MMDTLSIDDGLISPFSTKSIVMLLKRGIVSRDLGRAWNHAAVEDTVSFMT